VTWDRSWLFKETTTTVVEAPLASTQNASGDESCGTTSSMDNTRSGKVNNTNSTIGIGSKRTQQTIGTPNGMDNLKMQQ
jgi:hypothetical protein